MQFHFHTNQSHFHKNCFAPRLALKQKRKGTQRWPILLLLFMCQHPFFPTDFDSLTYLEGFCFPPSKDKPPSFMVKVLSVDLK